MPDIYPPAEDSYFLAEVLKKEINKVKNGKILDMGSGSGIQAETALSAGIKPGNITLADLNPEAISYLRRKFPESQVVRSDLFERLDPTEKFDIIAFNPPYLPEEKFDREMDTSGGEKGSKTINSFLKEAKRFLLPRGMIILLTSSLTKGISWESYSKKLVARKKIFFEELYVWELRLPKKSF